jgi:hypothetical protein
MTNERRCVRCTRRIYPRSTAPNWASIHAGRNLCLSCWQIARHHHGIPDDTPRLNRTRDELLDDYVILRADGYTWRQCAQRLNMNYPAFERAMLRARRDRDPRAARIGETDTLRKAG